ncbi:unnamed protein product [Vitrella brassicaformis CCMP3155]|uniref:1-deoxy-D-xylulose 5-phosphate reductoisomerase, apicoplastic n=1 Tax=Vitrella brassicaformis (strain CCMP3155) TaxID=1169540 RepID=A0A0G4EE32_VITBC|nr:unnamed protein product [Vitrella brassicaformis CCMP3155]|eukprot:CEL93618.1 unnamed protein product [Vitrella brassicaformis CCMP3155]
MSAMHTGPIPTLIFLSWLLFLTFDDHAVKGVAAFTSVPHQRSLRPALLSTRRRPIASSLTRMAHAAPTGSEESMKATFDEATNGVESFKRRISLLGSTGSIGTQTLDIIRERPQNFELVGLAARSNVELLAEQIREFRPAMVALEDGSKLGALEALLEGMEGDRPTLVTGMDGVCEVAKMDQADMVVTGIVGCAGLLPTIAAIENGKDVALANKETLIAAGPVIVPLLKKHGVFMTPADSEHSAIFQCLQGVPPGGLRKIILTASGGAFRDWRKEDLVNVRVEDALKHPNWAMGAKITIDSATLMNKGLEVIEAHYLFGASYDDIEVVIHPQSIIHSMVETQDTSVLAQLGWPDMRLPLVYAMSWPHRIPMHAYERLDLVKLGSLTFKAPDFDKYPCLRLAYEAGRMGGTMPAALNAANEMAVERFRQGEIHYLEIPKLIEFVMDAHRGDHKTEGITLDDILAVDAWAREKGREYVHVPQKQEQQQQQEREGLVGKADESLTLT